MKFFLLLFSFLSVAQATPYVVELPPLKEKKSLNKYIKGQPLKIAEAVPVNFDSSIHGEFWQESADGALLAIEISGEQPFMNLGFSSVFIPPQGSLRIIDPSSGEELMRYDEYDNKGHQQLWTESIYRQNIRVEFLVPTEYQQHARLALAQVNQGVNDELNKALASKSGACNIDVNCAEGDFFDNAIRSVARYTISNGSGTFTCTGQLVNNTEQDLTPYFLTAEHCLVSQTTAPSMVFFWNFQRPQCASGTGSSSQSQSGATFRAAWAGLDTGDTGSDMALVQLDSTPNAAFDVYYSGWDRRNITPNSAIAIHHPSGDEKSISFDDDVLTVTDYLSNSADTNLQEKFLRIGAWDEGTTEPGSSGSGIWNAERRLVGTLSGGLAACSTPTSSSDNNEPDWYGRFASHWEGDGTSDGQLKAWLDPQDLGVETLTGINNCTPPLISINVNQQNLNLGETASFSAVVAEGVTVASYAWDFDHDNNTDASTASAEFAYSSAFAGNARLEVTDSNGCTATASRAIVASASSNTTAPILTNTIANQTFTQGEFVSLDISNSFSGSDLTYKLINGPASLSISGCDGVISGIITNLDPLYSPYNASVLVSNGEVTDKIEFLITVNASDPDPNNENNAPLVASAISNLSLNVDDVVDLDLSTSFSDPDDDTLSFSMSGAPNCLSLSSDGRLTGTATSDSANLGAYTVVVTAGDGVDTVSTTFSVTITGANSGGDNNNDNNDDSGDDQGSTPPDDTPVVDNSSDSGGSFNLLLNFLFLFLLHIRRNKLKSSLRKTHYSDK